MRAHYATRYPLAQIAAGLKHALWLETLGLAVARPCPSIEVAPAAQTMPSASHRMDVVELAQMAALVPAPHREVQVVALLVERGAAVAAVVLAALVAQLVPAEIYNLAEQGKLHFVGELPDPSDGYSLAAGNMLARRPRSRRHFDYQMLADHLLSHKLLV